MNWVAIKMLMGDRIKYISLVAGLAFAALLVTQQASIFCGYAMRTRSWIGDTKCADLWVMNEQEDFTEANKPIIDNSLSRVRGVAGVQWAVPMYRGVLNCQLPDGTQQAVRLIGLDDATLMGGPPTLEQGSLSDLRKDKAVLINAAQANDILRLTKAKRPLAVGDSISINDNEAVVAGTYRATPEFFWQPVLYTTYSRALSIAPRERRSTMFVLVKVRPGVEPSQVAASINNMPGLKALTSMQFADETMDYVLKKTGILINFGMTIGLGFLIGVLVSGQTLYTFIIENLKHFASLKAMGLRTFGLIRMVALQVLVAGAIGYGIGVGGASLTGIAFEKIGLAFEMPWQILVLGATAILCCCLAAGLFALLRVIRLEPAMVFKG